MEHKKKQSMLEVNFSTIEDMYVCCIFITYISLVFSIFVIIYLMIKGF